MRWLRLLPTYVCLGALLGGCAGSPLQLSGLWSDEAPAAAAAPGAPLYCYRNLARVDCYTGPDPQRRH